MPALADNAVGGRYQYSGSGAVAGSGVEHRIGARVATHDAVRPLPRISSVTGPLAADFR